MSLYPCRSCGHDVSEDAESCPEWGAPHPAEGEKTAHRLTGSKERGVSASDAFAGIGLVLLILVAIAVLLRWRRIL